MKTIYKRFVNKFSKIAKTEDGRKLEAGTKDGIVHNLSSNVEREQEYTEKQTNEPIEIISIFDDSDRIGQEITRTGGWVRNLSLRKRVYLGKKMSGSQAK